jgi:uncharacterized repeat protein (TIGR01451 family)
MIKVQTSRSWLFWTGLLLLGLALVLIMASGSEISQALAPPDGVEVDKTVNVLSAEPGQVPAPLYTITFTNSNGTEVVLGAISDTLPAGFTFVDMHPLSDWQERPDDEEEPVIVWQGPITIPAASTLSLVYAVDTFDVAPSTSPFVNTVEAVTEDGSAIGPASAEIRLGIVDLDIDKTALPTRVQSGELFTYTVVVNNSGHLSGTVEAITDTMDTSLSFVRMGDDSDVTDAPHESLGTLAWSGPFEVPPLGALTLRYVVQAPDVSTWVYPNNEVKAKTSDRTLGPAGFQIVVGPETGRFYLPAVSRDFLQAHLALVKTAFPVEFTTEDGQAVFYTVTIQNVGDTTGKLTGVHDVLPAGFSFLGMESGSDVLSSPAINGQELTWTLDPPIQMPPGSQKKVIYRVAHSVLEGPFTNSVSVTAEEASVQEEPATATVTVERGILLADDFEAGMDQWTPFLNYWRLKEGQWYWSQTDGHNGSGGVTQDAYRIDPKEAEDALLMYLGQGAEDWTDYRMEAKMIIRTVNHPHGLWVRGHYQDVGDEDPAGWVTGYYIMIGGKADGQSHYVSLKQLQTLTDCWGNACDNPHNLYDFNNPHELTITKKDGSLARWAWHTVVVEVCGDRISVWLNGVKYIDNFQDPKEPFLTGTVGLKTYKANTVSFDDILVTPINCGQ